MFKTSLIRAGIAALFASAAFSASAAVFTVTDAAPYGAPGPAVSLPTTGPGANSFPELSSLGATGWNFGNLRTDESTQVKYEFLGFEAVYANAFQLGGQTVFQNDAPSGSDGIWMRMENGALPSATRGENGLLDFTFLIDGGAKGSLRNGDNVPVSTNPNENRDIFSYVYKLFDGGKTAYILLDDGNQFDDNHDDMVIRATIQQVPVPAPLALMGAGLVALGAARRRKA